MYPDLKVVIESKDRFLIGSVFDYFYLVRKINISSFDQ